VVLLYGIGQDMSFVSEIASDFTSQGIAILCPEQYGRGDRTVKATNKLHNMLTLRKRAWLAIVETRRIIDFLETRSDIVDPEKVYLLGISLGAMLGTSVLAQEPRLKGGILMWGGGDLPTLVRKSEVGSTLFKPWQLGLLSWGAWICRPLPIDPLDSVHLISGERPLLFQNALYDEIIPRICSEKVYDKAPEPKEIIWYECGHDKVTFTMRNRIINDQIVWLKKMEGIQIDLV